MARSLRDELLKAGLVTREHAARAERRGPPVSRPTGSKAPNKPARSSRGRGAKNTTKRESRVARELQPIAPGPAAPVRPEPDDRVKQLNVEIRRILHDEAEAPDPQSSFYSL